MKTQIEQLIHRLADKTLSFGCKLICVKDINEVNAGDVMTFLAQGKNKEGVFGMGKDEYIALKNETAGRRSPSDKAVLIKAHALTMYYEPIGHPVRIGDVLEKIDQLQLSDKVLERIFPEGLTSSQKRRGITLHRNNIDIAITHLWRACGFTQSLQEIFDRAEWEEQEVLRAIYGFGHEEVFTEPVPKQPEIRALFEYLLTLGI